MLQAVLTLGFAASLLLLGGQNSWEHSRTLRTFHPRTTLQCLVDNDLIIALDSSTNLNSDDFKKAKSFVSNVADVVTSQRKNRVAFYIFATEPQVVFELINSETPSQLRSQILTAPYFGSTGQQANFHYTLQDAYTELVKYNRSNVNQNFLIITGGKSTEPEQISPAAQQMIGAGVRNFVVGIGSNVQDNQLLDVVGGQSDNVFVAQDYDSLGNMVDQVIQAVCGDVPPTTNDLIVGQSPPASPPEEGSPSPVKYKVICYYTGWSTYRQGVGKFTPQDVDISLCTHIVYSFALLGTAGEIKVADPWIDIENRYYDQIIDLRKSGKKVSIGVGGWIDSEGSRWSNLLRNPGERILFIQSVKTFIKRFPFDGIDLVYEYPGCPAGKCSPEFQTDKHGFTALVMGLRAALPKRFIISAAVSWDRNVVDTGYDVSTISKYLDWIGVMAYDIHRSQDNRTGHIAPMYAHPLDTQDYSNVNSSINHWMMRGADPSKLILGIPLYGNSFTLSNSSEDDGLFAPTRGPGKSGPFTEERGILSYYEICSQQWEKKVQDEEGRMGPFVVKGDQWISYDDQSSIIKKTNYIKSLGLGGAMVWSLDFDDFGNICGQGNYPLLKTVKKSLIPESNS